MKTVLLLLVIPLLSLASCKSEKHVTSVSRYSTQTFAVAGGMAVITQITDHEANKIFYYKFDDNKGLALQSTVDLTKCGDRNIPFEDVVEREPESEE